MRQKKKSKTTQKKQGLTYIDAIYDLIDMGELDLEFDSGHENADDPEIVEAEEI